MAAEKGTEIFFTQVFQHREFVSHLHRNSISPKSIKRFLSSLRGFFNFLLKKKIIKKNFAEGVRSPKADKNLPEILQHSDINLLSVRSKKTSGGTSYEEVNKQIEKAKNIIKEYEKN